MSEPSCCSGLPYRPGIASLILGSAWHPGSVEASAKLASMMKASREEVFLDLGCGIGTTSRLLSEQFGCRVIGIDASPSSAGDALRRTVNSNATSFLAGDGEHIPVAEGTFDGAITECVLSILHDKPAAATELSRVLKPNGRLGVSDVVVEAELPEELRSPLTGAFCVGRALSVRGYLDVLEWGGFEVGVVEKMKQETLDFLGQVRRQIFLAKMLAGVGKLGLDQGDLDYAHRLLSLAITAVEKGELGYVTITARKCR